MNLEILAYLAVGLVLLVVGAEVLVRGAARLAAQLGISPLVIGLTVVAFGTSAPETAVSVQSALEGKGDLAIGNVLGSNIANVLLILGLTAAITPLIVSRQLIRLDVPLMILASLLTYGLALDGHLGMLDGGLLFSAILAYTLFLVISSRREQAKAASIKNDEFKEEFSLENSPEAHSWPRNVGLVVAGLVLLVAGSDFLVSGATALARVWGLSELIIGLTVVAVGTSLPELATSIMAALRGERDIAVGNIVGSNIFNLLCVLGLSAIVAPAPVPVSEAALAFDFPVMLGVAVACLPMFFAGYRINRWEGWLFLGYYCAYVAYLILSSTGRSAAQLLAESMLWYAIPLTSITLLVLAWRAWKRPPAH